MPNEFILYTDGACSGDQKSGKGMGKGPGGWAAVLLDPCGNRAAYCGHDPHTTNNRMELTAVVRGLEALGDSATLALVVTDSSYVKNAFTQGWIKQWEVRGWRSSRGDAVANQDLWRELIALVDRHIVRWKHVRGHQSNELNNLADRLAVEAKRDPALGAWSFQLL